MDYLSELDWGKENKKYLFISMRNLINIYFKFSYMYSAINNFFIQ